MKAAAKKRAIKQRSVTDERPGEPTRALILKQLAQDCKDHLPRCYIEGNFSSLRCVRNWRVLASVYILDEYILRRVQKEKQKQRGYRNADKLINHTS